MAQRANQVEIYLEAGKTRTFALAPDWPGWCRSGRDEASALQALCDYGPRYERALATTRIRFRPPVDPSDFVVVQRAEGNATTDFGAPAIALPQDVEPVAPAEMERWQAILRAVWRTFDATVHAANGQVLSKGPRGGGRELTKIIEHVEGADAGYLRALGGTLKSGDTNDPEQALAHVRQAMLTTLIASVDGEVPARGPRGGVRWTPRFFVRRLAWHELDHAWEIEDRVG